MRARSSRSHHVFAGAALATASILGLAAPASAAEVLTYPAEISPGLTVTSGFPDYVLDIDCDTFETPLVDGEPTTFDLVWVPGGSLDVRFTCLAGVKGDPIDTDLEDAFPDGFDIRDPEGEFVTVYGVWPNTTERFTTLTTETLDLSYFASVEIDDPAGTLLLSQTVAIPAGGTQDAEFVDTCGSDGARVYETFDFTVLSDGTYTFRVVDVSPVQTGDLVNDAFGGPSFRAYLPNPWGDYMPISDTCLAIYTSFNSSDTEVGVVEWNDDTNAGPDGFGPGGPELHDGQGRFISSVYSELILDLAPGTYTLLLTTYDDIGTGVAPDSAPAKAELSSTGLPAVSPALYETTDLPEMTGTIDFWGPEGGLLLDAQLAATGTPQQAVSVLSAFAALFLLAGAAVVVATRRAATRSAASRTSCA